MFYLTWQSEGLKVFSTTQPGKWLQYYCTKLYKIGIYSEDDWLKINLKNTLQHKLTTDEHRNIIEMFSEKLIIKNTEK